MIPRSKQPNEFDAFCDPDWESEEEFADNAASLEESAALRALAERLDPPGSGAGEPVTQEGRRSPADFSAEELSLARELNALFSVEREELPPLFVQTLAGKPQSWAPPSGLIHRVTYRVSRRLHLPRRLFQAKLPVPKPAGVRELGRLPRTVGLSTVLALVLLSLVTVAPSFAQGMRLLLQQTGVQVAPSYPKQAGASLALTQYISPHEVQEEVPYPVYWLGYNPGGYHYQSLLLHVGQEWADGPVVEAQYRLPNASGTGLLSVRQFRPMGGNTVLLVVAPKAAWYVQVAGQPAIYINGRWVRHRGELVWEYDTQAELVYQNNGLIFWITADQRDGATPAMLETLATSLEHLNLQMPRPRMPELPPPPRAQLAAALAQAVLGDVVELLPATAPDTGAGVYIALGQPPDDGA